MITKKCPECGSKTWRNPDNHDLNKHDIHRICDDCGQEYFTDVPYEELAGKSALDKQVDGNHYKDMKIQPVQFCRANHMGGLESSVVRYITRHKVKNGRVDIEKAIHCLELILEMDYGSE